MDRRGRNTSQSQNAVTERQVRVEGNGNIVAGGDINVAGDVHFKTIQEKRDASKDYLLMLPDERGDITAPVVCHVKVRNSSQSQVARGCQGYMQTISLCHGVWEQIESFPLKWKLDESSKSVDIPPGYTRFLDAFVLHKTDENFIIGRNVLVDTHIGFFERRVPVAYEGMVKIRFEVFDADGARGFGTYLIHFQRGRNPSIEFIPQKWLD